VIPYYHILQAPSLFDNTCRTILVMPRELHRPQWCRTILQILSHIGWLISSLVRHRLPYRYDQNPIWYFYIAQGSYTPTSKIFPSIIRLFGCARGASNFWLDQSFFTVHSHVHRFSHYSSLGYFQITLPIKSPPWVPIKTYLHNLMIILPSKYPTS